MARALALALACASLSLAPRLATAQAREHLAISCGSTGAELALCREATGRWAQAHGMDVQLVTMPNGDTLSLTQQLLASRSDDIDIFQIDVAWTGILARDLLPLDEVRAAVASEHFPMLVHASTVDGHLYAVPWFGDIGALYYRKDLLEKYHQPVPRTWAQLAATAAQVQQAERQLGKPKFWGFVWQGRAYEGLTCNALEWLPAASVEALLGTHGTVQVETPPLHLALDRAHAWVGAISPAGVLNHTEEDSRGIFQTGNALFMRNWPYALALVDAPGSPVAGRVGVAVLPANEAGEAPSGIIAGSLLVVNRRTRHPREALDLVLALTSQAEEKRRATLAGYIPSRPAVFSDREVEQAHPYFAELLPALQNARERPYAIARGKYNRVSIEFSNAVHDALTGEERTDDALHTLGRQLTRLGRRGQW